MAFMTAGRPRLRGSGGMETMGMTGLCISHPSFTNHIIHLYLQTVPGFAAFLWDNQPNLSS